MSRPIVPLQKKANSALQLPKRGALAGMKGDLCGHLPEGQPDASAGAGDAIVSIHRLASQSREREGRPGQAHPHLKEFVFDRTAELRATILTLESQAAERKLMESALRHSHAELQRLSRRSLLALEADRQWISKELHDSIGASLAAIKLGLEESLLQLEQTSQKGSSKLKQTIGYLVDTIKETKRVAARLRPLTLDDLGLISTIQAYCREFKVKHAHIEIETTVRSREADIHPEQKILIYRVLQEAMLNAACHGHARRIRITLARNDDAIEFRIEDDGCGFDPGSPGTGDPGSSHGIGIMRERVAISGGSFELDSAIGCGTRLRVALPCSQAECGSHSLQPLRC
jgi:signal transduction histidine kinase